MPLVPLNIPKGQYANGTEYQSLGRWRDVNLVRWHEDALRPVGGWRPRSQSNNTAVNVSGVVRGVHAWVDNDGERFAAFGTHNKLVTMLESSVTHDITPSGLTTGRVDAAVNTGWGSGGWGLFSWGVARPDLGSILTATTWSLDNFGEQLIACSSDDGKVYYWDLNTANNAVQVPNSPVGSNAILVTEERFLVCLGCDTSSSVTNNRRVAWSDQEDYTVWTAAATNQAGDIELQTNGKILAGVRTRGQSLILTDQDAHTMTYQGPPFVYGFERVGTACGLIGAGAYASVDMGVIWMGRRGFFIYSGGAVREIPCSIGDLVFSNLNYDQASKVQSVVNSQWNEIWWFYQSQDSDECDKYVAYDYVENIWTSGTLSRTSGIDRGVFRLPFMVADGGVVYEHEIGQSYDASVPFAETGPIAIGTGDRLMKVTKVIPDEKTQGDVNLIFKTRNYPNGAETTHGTYSTANPTSVRFQGRQVRMKVEANQNSDWRVGIMRLDARQGSKR
tara:strand:+ start:2734 stop:4242 length:1509 start_codon:yes stop_codon:yes gene_type:complete